MDVVLLHVHGQEHVLLRGTTGVIVPLRVEALGFRIVAGDTESSGDSGSKGSKSDNSDSVPGTRMFCVSSGSLSRESVSKF